jgi:N-acetylglucosamine kinase-like BadF-type ATPase
VPSIRYYVGIEGFCMRHSVGVLALQNGRIRSSVRQPFTMSLHTTDASTLASRVSQLLFELYRRAHLPMSALDESAVCLSLSGVTFSYDRLALLPRVLADAELSFGRLICTGDAEVTFASHAQCSQGSLVLSHCGSTAYAVGIRDGGLRHYRFGGWGPAIGDDGSGFWIGREALRAVSVESDAHLPDSILWQEMRSWLDSPTRGATAWADASQRWKLLSREYLEANPPNRDPRTLLFALAHQIAVRDTDDTWRKTVAGLAIPVMNALKREDPSAVDIVDRAVGHLAAQHAGACDVGRKLAGLDTFLPLVLCGGVLNHNKVVRDKLCVRLSEQLRQEITPVLSSDERTMRPALGALMFALGDSTTHGLQLPSPEVIEQLQREHRVPSYHVDLKND